MATDPIKNVTRRTEGAVARSPSGPSLRPQTHPLGDLLDHTMTGVIFADDMKQITDCNDTILAMFSYARRDLVGQPLSLLLPTFLPEDVELFPLADATAPVTQLRLGRNQFGRRFPVEVSYALWNDGTGRRSFGAIIRDVTSRKNVEDELRRSQVYLDEIQKIARLGSWDWSVDEDRLTLSDEMCRLVQLPIGSVLKGRELLQMIHPDDVAGFKSEIARLMGGESSQNMTFRLVHPDMPVRVLRGSARLVEGWDGQTSRLIGIAQDVTAILHQEVAERQREKLMALGELAGGVAHELNNLLQPILSLTELSLDRCGAGPLTGEASAEMRDHLAVVVDATRKAREIVRQILRFSRKEASSLARIDIIAELDKTIAFIRDILPAGVALSFDHPTDPSGIAVINPVELTQVLTNLALNGAHAMDGQGRLDIAACRRTLSRDDCTALGLQPGSYFEVTVKDGGRGMTQSTMERIFEPFFTTKPIGEGTGLGLSVAHGIIRSWQGAITVDSEPGCGTCFSLFIPEAS